MWPTCTCWPQHGGWVVDGRTFSEWAGAAAQESIRGQCTGPGAALLPPPGGEANWAGEGGWRAVGYTHLGLQPVQAPPGSSCVHHAASRRLHNWLHRRLHRSAGETHCQPRLQGRQSSCVLRRCSMRVGGAGVVSCDTCTSSCRPALWFSAGWDSRRHAPRQVRCRTGALPASAAVP